MRTDNIQRQLESIDQMSQKLAADHQQLATNQEQFAAMQEDFAAKQEQTTADQERQGHLLQALVVEQQWMRESMFLNCEPNSLPPQRGGDHVSHILYNLFGFLLNCLLFTLILRAFPSLQLLLL